MPWLRNLHIWLDHNGPSNEYWSVVNERAILAPMEAIKTTHNPDLKLVCFLPNLHPEIENRQRHYLPGEREEENPPSQLEIHRLLRQRYRVLEHTDIRGIRGTCPKHVRYYEDFPPLIGNPAFNAVSLAEYWGMQRDWGCSGEIDMDSWGSDQWDLGSSDASM